MIVFIVLARKTTYKVFWNNPSISQHKTEQNEDSARNTAQAFKETLKNLRRRRCGWMIDLSARSRFFNASSWARGRRLWKVDLSVRLKVFSLLSRVRSSEKTHAQFEQSPHSLHNPWAVCATQARIVQLRRGLYTVFDPRLLWKHTGKMEKKVLDLVGRFLHHSLTNGSIPSAAASKTKRQYCYERESMRETVWNPRCLRIVMTLKSSAFLSILLLAFVLWSRPFEGFRIKNA